MQFMSLVELWGVAVKTIYNIETWLDMRLTQWEIRSMKSMKKRDVFRPSTSMHICNLHENYFNF